MTEPTMKSLLERVADYVAACPGETLEEIARGVTARQSSVRDVLADPAFFATDRAAYPSDRAQVYRLAPRAADGLGRAARRSQGSLIAAVLADGEWHTTREIHRLCGFSRLNSRIAELRRKKGMIIECRHIPGRLCGPDAQEYRFEGFQKGFGPSREAEVEHPSVGAGVVPSVSQGRPSRLGEAA